MVIRRLLKYSAFGPEEIEIVAMAYEDTLAALDLANGDSPVTEIVAKKIIEIAQTGEVDPARIRGRAVAELGFPNAA